MSEQALCNWRKARSLTMGEKLQAIAAEWKKQALICTSAGNFSNAINVEYDRLFLFPPSCPTCGQAWIHSSEEVR